MEGSAPFPYLKSAIKVLYAFQLCLTLSDVSINFVIRVDLRQGKQKIIQDIVLVILSALQKTVLLFFLSLIIIAPLSSPFCLA